MTHPAVRTQVHETLDVHGVLAAQIAFDRGLGEHRADRVDLDLGEILHLGGRVDARGSADVLRARTAHAKDVREPDHHVLVHRDVDAGYACHVRTLLVLLTLTLLVTRVRADDVHDAATAHDLAVLADFLDRGTYFHVLNPNYCGAPLRP